MVGMYKKLVGGLMMATLIHGNNAQECMSEAEKMALQNEAMGKLTDACKAVVASDSGEPPECKDTATACGMMVDLEINFNCTGDACSMVPQSVLAAQSKTIPTQQCFPKACDNEADKAVFVEFSQEDMKQEMCSGLVESMKQTLASLSVSITPIVTVAKQIQMSCEKNADGQIEIDGVVIPTPPKSSDGDDDHDHGHEHTGGSMTTCGDVKNAYKAAGCCGNPMKTFSMGMNRRLSDEQAEEELLESVKIALLKAKAEGGSSKARSLAESLGAIVAKHA